MVHACDDANMNVRSRRVGGECGALVCAAVPVAAPADAQLHTVLDCCECRAVRPEPMQDHGIPGRVEAWIFIDCW